MAHPRPKRSPGVGNVGGPVRACLALAPGETFGFLAGAARTKLKKRVTGRSNRQNVSVVG